PHRGQDVALLSIRVMNAGDSRGAVGIVFDGRHLPRNPVLVPLEIHDAIAALVPAAPMTHRQPSEVVASPGLVVLLQEALERPALGDLLEGVAGPESPAG